MKTAELTRSALNWAVSKCEEAEGCKPFYPSPYDGYGNGPVYMPEPYSTDWSLGGPIIERQKIATEGIWNTRGCGVRTSFEKWMALHPKDYGGLIRCRGYGPTLLIAAMRCYVASKLGDDVDVPEELVL